MIETEIDLTRVLEHGTSLDDDDTDADFVTAVRILDCHNLLGEGILFDDKRHAVMWPDIYGKTFHQLLLNYETPNKVIYRIYDNLPKQLCSFGLLDEDEIVVDSKISLPILCAWEDGFQIYDIAKSIAISDMSIGEDVNPLKLPTRLNDGRVAPECTRYICGGYYGEQKDTYMKVYKVEQNNNDNNKQQQLVHTPIVDKIQVTNSICWSLDGKIMYLADSPTKQINKYDYDVNTGTVSNKTLLHTKPNNERSVPDGSCIDKDGYIWNAVWKNGESASYVQRIDPNTGLVVFTVHMPDTTSQVSCCCFGGQNLDILFITTASESMDPKKEPHAGALYAAKVPYQGKPENRFKWAGGEK